MFGCYSRKLHRLLPGRESLEASVPSSCLMVFTPGESWARRAEGCGAELPAWKRGGLTSLWAGHSRLRSKSPQPWCYTSITAMLPGQPPAFPCCLGQASSGMCFGPSSVLVLTPLFNTSATGLNKRELLCSPLSAIHAKTLPAQPPSRRTQTHGPTSCQAYREEVPEQLM